MVFAPQVYCIGGGAFGQCLVLLLKRPQRIPSPLHHVRIQPDDACYEVERLLSPEPDRAGTFILDF